MARFGLGDDSDEDEVLQNVQAPKKTVPVEPKINEEKTRVTSPPMTADELATPPHRRPQRPTANALLEDDQGDYRYAHESGLRERVETSDEEDDRLDEDQQGPPRIVKQPAPWAAKLGMEPHKMHVMQASFFRVPEEEAAMRAAAERATTAGKTKPRQHADKLLSASARLARKHSRGSEMGGESMQVDKGQRMSFDQSLDFVPHRPTRKFARVEGVHSVSAGQDGSYVDAGLAFGRSFRVSWGPGGRLARIGGSVASSVVYIDTIRMVPQDEDKECALSTRLLQVHLQHSAIELDEASIPIASPSRSLTFFTFASLFPQHDNCHEAQVWRQGVALFDPLETRLPSSTFAPPSIRHRLSAIQRRIALCEWLTSTVAPTVAAALRADPSASSAQRIYLRLAGNQIEEAVEDAISDGNVRLAMLLSQAGGDADFRGDIEDQLAIWREEGADQFIDETYRKCLALLAGITDIWKAPNRDSRHETCDVNVVKGLDWKRAFGLALWYGEGSDGGEGYERAVEQYARTMGQNDAPLPLPWYKDSASASTSSSSLSTVATSSSLASNSADEEVDGLFELLRLSTAATPLERAIYPRAFSPSHLDYRMTWHLYTLLSRAMRLKDFSDRQNPTLGTLDDDEQDIEGHSETADGVTSSYAAQLEALGQIQEAAFVLLHLEGSEGRKKAIKELLMRQAHTLEDWQVVGLSSLRIPMEWVEEAKACLSQYEGYSFDAYEHFLRADEQRLAHDIAVNELAPDAVIRGDHTLLRALFKPFDPQAVDNWSFRGKLYVDYADAIERIPFLVAASQDTVLDATDAAELERLKALTPQLIRLLPDVLRDRSDARQNAALSEMLSGLLLCFDTVKTKSGLQPQIEFALVDEATRLRHIHNTAYDRFLRSVYIVT